MIDTSVKLVCNHWYAMEARLQALTAAFHTPMAAARDARYQGEVVGSTRVSSSFEGDLLRAQSDLLCSMSLESPDHAQRGETNEKKLVTTTPRGISNGTDAEHLHLEDQVLHDDSEVASGRHTDSTLTEPLTTEARVTGIAAASPGLSRRQAASIRAHNYWYQCPFGISEVDNSDPFLQPNVF